jgi:hypothetical protein
MRFMVMVKANRDSEAGTDRRVMEGRSARPKS